MSRDQSSAPRFKNGVRLCIGSVARHRFSNVGRKRSVTIGEPGGLSLLSPWWLVPPSPQRGGRPAPPFVLIPLGVRILCQASLGRGRSVSTPPLVHVKVVSVPKPRER